jgi:hypothetical protein
MFFRVLIIFISITNTFAESQTPITKVKLLTELSKKSFKNLGADSPLSVMYYVEKGLMPSCGLIANVKSVFITPVFETEPSEGFPYCEGIPEAASFNFKGNKFFVFKYIQKDTSEDAYPYYFFAQRLENGELIPIEKLNGESIPKNQKITQIAKWAKSKLEKNP